MPLRTTDRDVAAICLVPPGNVAREIALLKRRLFSMTGEALALALPEFVLLSAHAWEPGMGRKLRRREMAIGLEAAWSGIEGGFAITEPSLDSGWLALGLDGPVEALRRAIGPLVEEGAEEAHPAFPIVSAFLLCPLGEEAGSAMLADVAAPPRLAFHAAELALFRIRFTGEGLSATTWARQCGARRRTGRRMSGSL